MQVKDRFTDDEVTGTAYSIPCRDCDSVYIGETDRSLQTRIKERQAAVRREDPKLQVSEHEQRYRPRSHDLRADDYLKTEILRSWL